MGGGGSTLDGGGDIYLEWGDCEGYLPWMGEGVPTLDGMGGGIPTLEWRGGEGTYLGQVMPRAVRLMRLPAGGLSCK